VILWIKEEEIPELEKIVKNSCIKEKNRKNKK